MDYSQTAEIPFNNFYLIEFFKHSLNKLESQVAESHVKLLDDLGSYLIREENLINGLEKIARQQYTNDLAISLFDIYERLGELPPEQAHADVEAAAEDFTNLYALMMEDRESVAAVQQIVAEFKAQYGEEEKEKQLEEFMEMAQADDTEVMKKSLLSKPQLDFDTFIARESSQRLYGLLAGDPRAEAFNQVFNNVLAYLASAPDKTSYPANIKKLFSAVKPLTPAGQLSPSELYLNLDAHVSTIHEALKNFEERDGELFSRFLDRIEFADEKKPPRTEEAPAETASLDELLHAYFKAEVEDWIGELKKGLAAVSSPHYWKLPREACKAFKEMSMIHGYRAYEHVAQLLLDRFQQWESEDKIIGDENTFSALYELLQDAGMYGDKKTAGPLLEKILSTLDAAGENLVAEESALPETAEVEEAEAPPEAETAEEASGEPVMPYGDQLAADWLREAAAFAARQNSLAAISEKRDSLKHLLQALAANHFAFPAHFTHELIPGLDRLFDRLSEGGNEAGTDLEVWNGIWEKLRDEELEKIDLAAMNRALDERENATAVLGWQDEQVLQALAEVALRQWNRLSENFYGLFINPLEAGEASLFIDTLDDNLRMLEMPMFQAFSSAMCTYRDQARSAAFNEEDARELASAFKLFMDRLKGAAGDQSCADIIEILSDVVESPQALLEEDEPVSGEEPGAEVEEAAPQAEAERDATEEPPGEMVEEHAPPEDADDDSILFREETEAFLKELFEFHDRFKENRERAELRKMENSVHGIRSASHMLGFSNVSALASSMESILEMFGQSDLEYPPHLSEVLDEALRGMEKSIADPQGDTSALCDKLDELLDFVVIGGDKKSMDEATDTEAGTAREAHPKLNKVADEQPLFAEGSDEDEELREIFKEESATFIYDIAESNKQLLENPNDIQAAESLSYAAHSLKSAAKMLGFKEISQLTDALERLFEAILKKEVGHNQALFEKIEESIELLQVLSDGKELSQTKIGLLLSQLEPDMWRVSVEEEEPAESAESNPEIGLIFYDEASEIIGHLNNELLELEKIPESEMILSNIQRRLHTLKGSAFVSGFKRIGDLAHKLEDYFQLFKEKDVLVKQEMFDAAFTAMDLLREMIQTIPEKGSDEVDRYLFRLAEIDNKLFLYQNYDQGPRGEVAAGQSVSTSPVSSKSDEDNIIRISTEYMDKLVDMASELMINQTQLGSNLHDLKEVLADIEGEKKQIRTAENIIDEALSRGALEDEEDLENKQKTVDAISNNIKEVVQSVNMIYSDLNKLTEGLEHNIGRVAAISKLLHADMLKARMVPVDMLFSRYPRAVRDLAKKQKKKVNLIIEDNNTEMDRAMIEGLAEPVLHIIRNAVDHGLETPAERKKAGKAETGTLILRAHQDKNQIVIDVEDDGRGIDVEAIRKKLIEKEIVEPERVERLTEAELLDYIFYPGFTTRDEATDVSGRGIGLDAVANQIQKLKGNVRLNTEAGVGTSFSLRVPLTLVLSQALMVKLGRQTIAIPVITVQETVQFKKEEIVRDDDKGYLRVRGRLLPYLELSEVLKFDEPREGAEKSEMLAVVLFDAGVSMALGIDEIIGRREVVIKSLGSHLQNVDYISGGTILANGEVALILDYARVIRYVENQYFGKPMDRPAVRRSVRKAPPEEAGAKEERPGEKKETPAASDGQTPKNRIVKGRKPVILIVDDSNSVRNFVGSILERNGFETVKAVNGLDALEKVKDEEIDLMITDLEMPKMHGFELISSMRKQERFETLPIIILTGRAGIKHRQTAAEEGADAFIVKPFKEKDLLQALDQFIKTA